MVCCQCCMDNRTRLLSRHNSEEEWTNPRSFFRCFWYGEYRATAHTSSDLVAAVCHFWEPNYSSWPARSPHPTPREFSVQRFERWHMSTIHTHRRAHSRTQNTNFDYNWSLSSVGAPDNYKARSIGISWQLPTSFITLFTRSHHVSKEVISTPVKCNKLFYRTQT